MHAALFGERAPVRRARHDFAGLSALPPSCCWASACGLLAVVISRGLFLVERAYRRLPIGEFWHPAIGAVGLRPVGLACPGRWAWATTPSSDVLDGRLAAGRWRCSAGPS